MGAMLDIDTSIVPQKLYFKIGEVAKLSKVKPYVLRYWQTEFEEISPIKSKTNQRLYRRQDVELVLLLKHLLHDLGYTLSGARKVLKNQPSIKQNNQKEQLNLKLDKDIDSKDLIQKKEILIKKCELLITEMKKSF